MASNPYPNVLPVARTGGVYYSDKVVLPAAEGVLATTPGTANVSPIPVDFGQVVLAIVEFTTVGLILSDMSYVVMQTDLGDGNWLDVAWCTYTDLGPGPAVFGLSGGGPGANAFQQGRASGTAPSPATGANQIPLGGRLRFVGKASFSSMNSSSSNAPGVVSEVIVNILYKLISPR